MPVLDQIFGPEHADIIHQVRAQNRALADEFVERLTRPLPDEPVSEWAQRGIRFDEPKFRDMFSLRKRQFMAEPLDLWRRDISNDINDIVLAWATRCGKDRIFYAGLGYRIANDPVRALVTKPMKQGAGGSRSDVNTKFIPMLKASPGLREHVARCGRYALNSGQQRIAGSVIDWEGTGSPKQLSGNPDDVVVQNECDGYLQKGETEAHPSILADERTKDASNPLRYKCCQPTTENNVIWTGLMRGDLRRRFVPCPRCSPLRGAAPSEVMEIPGLHSGLVNTIKRPRYTFKELIERKFMILGWSEQYNVLPTKMPDGAAIPMAYVKWDAAAKSKTGDWDIARVIATAHWICPHCQGPVYNHEKEWMDELGQWHPTKTGAPGFASFQLSSLYVSHDETSVGNLAAKFLAARNSGRSMKGFINNDLAEVDVMQEHGQNKIEINSLPLSQPDWVPMLTADFHKNHPYIWFVVRKWCAFKLLPPFAITNGRPDFVPLLDLPGNEEPKKLSLALVDGFEPAWLVLADLVRFKNAENHSPIFDFLISQKLVGQKLVTFFRETANSNTMDFRRALYREMSQHQFGKPDAIACPRGGDSELIAAGHLELSGEQVWRELREIETEFHVGKGMTLDRRCVAIDCGYAEKFNREVLRQCYERAGHYKWYDPMSKNHPAQFHGLWKQGESPAPAKHRFCLPCPADGWFALRGKPTNRPLGDGKINHELSIHVEDPFYGQIEAGTKMVEVLEVPQGLFWIRKNDLRMKRVKQKYGISPTVSLFPKHYLPDGTRTEDSLFKLADYEKQLNEQYFNETTKKVEPKHGRGGTQNRAFPYHLDDCETYQVALATHNEFFDDSQK